MTEVKRGFADLGPEMPPPEQFLRGKALLQSMHGGGPGMHDENRDSDPTTGNLYEHLVTLLKVILEQQPTHAMDQFEELSRQVKRELGGGAGGSGAGAGLVQEDIEATAPTAREDTPEYLHAKTERTLLKHPKHKWDDVVFSKSPLPAPWGGYYDDDDEIQRMQNLGQASFLVEQAGAGLGRSEMLRVWLSIRKLSLKLTTVVKLRFWGKIMGTQGCYYIAEGEFEAGMDADSGVEGPFDNWRPFTAEPQSSDKAVPVREVSENSEQKPEKEMSPEEAKLAEARVVALENLPKNKWVPRAPIPAEARGRGTNRWDYFACTKLGSDEWFRLPPARPEHIVYARHIRHLFVGRPDAPVPRSPGALGDFPGLEVHLLRAQIARITSATWISPAGLYQVDEEAELEEGEQPETLMEVEEFEPPQFEELLDAANWQHTRPYILPQGRCSFVSQKRAAAALRENMDDPKEKRATKPKGRTIRLTSRPLPAWRVYPSTVLLPKNCSVAIVSSGRWPGAYTLARGADFVNIYVGWGQKSLASNFSPMWYPNVMKEFSEDAMPLIETNDPTPLEEEAVRAAKEARRLAREARAEEAEEEAEPEEEDED
ncbi:radial spoke head protein 4 homolog A [Clonorchis sinensis]|uniref:Radial spoke head protein 4 homolog A n=2 Tax=Opisthorchiidae TaxID=6196 RepID=G7YDZ6_CLOSI|nr:radial spoke head protein 4 homolog A [Clonorchis sinensis]